MDQRELSELEKVEGLLEYPAGFDHWCDDDDCTLDTPKCGDMHMRAALQKLRETLEPPHKSLQPARLTNDPERIYLEQWQRDNERQAGVNRGFTLLEWILCPSGQRLPNRVTHRDSEVAASVIQWLGTTCGMCFIRNCERQIDEARAERRQWADYVNINVEPPEGDLRTAELLAGCVEGHPQHDRLVREICGALAHVRKSVLKEALEAALTAPVESQHAKV